MTNDTIIKQYAKRIQKEYINEFYNFIYVLLNNLIDTDIDSNLKLVLTNNLMFDKTIYFFKNDEDKLQVGRLAQVITKDENLIPIDVKVKTISGKSYLLTRENYVVLYNPIAIDYLRTKIEEISNVEKIISYLRKLYKMPYVIKSKDSKALKAIKDFLKKIFDYDEVCTVVNEGFNVSEQLNKVDLKVDYITDKLLDENESLKEDILECLGIYKNTSSNRERVNESELIISNSLTTVNKLGIESSLIKVFKEIKEKLGFDYNIELNINKIFSVLEGSED